MKQRIAFFSRFKSLVSFCKHDRVVKELKVYRKVKPITLPKHDQLYRGLPVNVFMSDFSLNTAIALVSHVHLVKSDLNTKHLHPTIKPKIILNAMRIEHTKIKTNHKLCPQNHQYGLVMDNALSFDEDSGSSQCILEITSLRHNCRYTLEPATRKFELASFNIVGSLGFN